MKLIDVITMCDKLKPNEYSQQQKRKWAEKIESDIRRYAAMHSGKDADISFKDESNPTLFLGEDFSDIYVYYLISMIDLSNQEYQLYNNSASYFNSVFTGWKKQHRRENLPQCDVSLNF